MGSMTSEEFQARIVLASRSEPGDEAVAGAVAEYGCVAVLEGAGNPLTSRCRASRFEAEKSFAALVQDTKACGARVIVPGDSEWPTQVSDLSAPPLALWVRGEADLRIACLRSVSIVGARASTAYGERVASSFAADLALREWTVISGGAFGIDAAAHRGALSAAGCTVAVLAGGVDVDYPKAHGQLFARVVEEGGALVSECPPRVAPRRHRFLERNRVIAALSRATIVVEAAMRSGARATAARAGEIGREVMAVPGPVTSSQSGGTNALLQSGDATLVCRPEDVVDGILKPFAPGSGSWADTDVAKALIRSSWITSEELAAATHRSHGQVLAILTEGEMQGMASREERGWTSSVGVDRGGR